MNNYAKPGFPVTKENKISKSEIEALKEAGHVVIIYPKKKLVVVDGFKRYSL